MTNFRPEAPIENETLAIMGGLEVVTFDVRPHTMKGVTHSVLTPCQ